MAVHPGAVIAVAGLAVAGFRLYTALSNSAQIVRSSLERYNDEKIRYYTVNKQVLEKQVLEKVVDYGKFKLELWDEFGALAQLYSRMTNPPGLISYKGMESVHAGRPQMDDIRNMTAALKALHEQQWDVVGTGMSCHLWKDDDAESGKRPGTAHRRIPGYRRRRQRA